MRFLGVHLPCFRLERAGWSATETVVLLAEEKSAERVQALSPPAYAAGIRRGMTLAEARAVLPSVRHDTLDDVGEVHDLQALSDAMVRFTPVVAAWPPEDLVLEVGPEVLPAVRRTLGLLGHACRLVAASEPEAARILARHATEDRVVPEDELRRALAPLPVMALGLDAEVVETLGDVGIKTIGAFAALPAATLTTRYGAEVARLHALARGEPGHRPLPPILPREEPVYGVELDDPVEQLDAVLFVLHGLVRDLVAELEQQGQAAVRVQVRFRLESGEHLLSVRLGQPSRGADRIFKLLKLRLEKVQLGAPVVAVALELLEAASWRAPQPGLFDRSDAPEPLPELIARLVDTLGPGAVVRPVEVDSHRPEAAWTAVPVGGEAPAAEPGNKLDPALPHEPEGLATVTVDGANRPRAERHHPRPPVLLTVPQAVRVAAAPSGKPRAMMERDDWVAIAEADGPERLAGEWWAVSAHLRDYWRVRFVDGRAAWMFRDTVSGDNGEVWQRWFLHGWLEAGPVPKKQPPPLRVLRRPTGAPRYAELCARSNYSFTEGASFPEELVETAQKLGLHAVAMTDRDGVYGNVRLHRAHKKSGFPVIHGSLLTVRTGHEKVDAGARGASVVALVQDLRGWGTLCRLLTAARAETTKGRAELPIETLLGDNQGLILLARGGWDDASIARVRESASDRFYRAISRRLEADEEARIDSIVRGELPCVAIGDVLMHDATRQHVQDVLTCIRLGLTLPQAGRRLQPNAERILKAPERMARLFSRWPGVVERSVEIAERCNFSLAELKYSYPHEVVPEGYAPIDWLRELVRRGLHRRYNGSPPERVRRQVDYELGVIERLNFPAYFLTVHDLVRFARSRGILCQGRGSAANSACCYALGITAVDPASADLLFERFISEERAEPPDIDVDFEHERREEVIQYVYEKYGRHRAGMVNEVIMWRGRSAMRDVGKAVGLGPDRVDALAKLMDMWSLGTPDPERLKEVGLDPGDEGVRLAMAVARDVQGFPRHTSIHVGGFVISDGPLIDRVPIEPATMENRTVIQWDKDDIDEVGFVKVDLLSLGMLSAIRKCFDLMRAWHGVSHDLSTVPREDPAVYDMLGEADSTGVFQVESRAQQGMLPRLKPRTFYDLVIEVSIVRPGPIQGGMVHPYLRRRQGLEPVEYADDRLRPILERTLGVPIFQEQVMAMAVAVGGFTPGEADQLRRSMGAWRKRGGLEEISNDLQSRLVKNGIQPEYAEQIGKQIQGFAEYGFPESHAASFAHLVYVSSWQRCHFPAAFCAALINSQPMGFYAPRSLVADVQWHGVEVRPIDVRVSDWDCTLEPGGDGPALRLGLRLVKGLEQTEGEALVTLRRERPFRDLPDLAARTGMDRGALRKLARADALRGLEGEVPRRKAAWAVEGLWPGMFAELRREDDEVPIPEANALDELQADYKATGLSVASHPLLLARPTLTKEGILPLGRLLEVPDGTTVRIAGLVGVRQRPETASGVVFLMLEDETGTANVVVWPKLYQKQRQVLRGHQLLKIAGVVQRQDGAISVVAKRVWPLLIAPDLATRSRDFR